MSVAIQKSITVIVYVMKLSIATVLQKMSSIQIVNTKDGKWNSAYKVYHLQKRTNNVNCNSAFKSQQLL